MCIFPLITLITVDSTPIFVGPLSNIIFTLLFSSLKISFIFVPLGLPDIFALGAASGVLASLIKFLRFLLLAYVCQLYQAQPILYLEQFFFF